MLTSWSLAATPQPRDIRAPYKGKGKGKDRGKCKFDKDKNDGEDDKGKGKGECKQGVMDW